MPRNYSGNTSDSPRHDKAWNSGVRDNGGSSRPDTTEDGSLAELAPSTTDTDLLRDLHYFLGWAVDEISGIGPPHSKESLYGPGSGYDAT